jgi:hypothetical protein
MSLVDNTCLTQSATSFARSDNASDGQLERGSDVVLDPAKWQGAVVLR